MWIRPGFETYWRAPGESQIGLDPRCALLLSGLDASEQRLLDQLSRTSDVAELTVRGRELGVKAGAVEELVQRLREADYVLDAPATASTAVPVHADSAYWHRAALAGHERPADRGDAVVALHGLDALGVRLAGILAQAGLGTILLHDDAPVRPDDVGGGLYRTSDVGQRRQDAALSALRAIEPRVRTRVEPGTRADLTILVEHSVVDPVHYREAMREDLWHLPIIVRDLDVMIGPVVRPGHGACLRCVDLHRRDADTRWPVVATQAASRPGRGVETALGWLAASLAAHQVLAVADGRSSELLGHSLEVTGWDPMPVRRTWPAHPECGCAPAALTA